MMREDINKNEILQKVMPVVEKIATDLGLTLVELNFMLEAGRWHLKVFIYSYDHPISHDDCGNMTRKLDEYLDQLIPIPYCLEVSSPGIDRKIKSPREYTIFKGKKAEIKLKKPIEPENLKKFVATILDYSSESGLKVQVDETSEILELNDNNISSVRLKADYKI